MKLAIIGSRGFQDYDMLCRTMAINTRPVSEIISGEAKGADTLGKTYALENKISYNPFPAKWNDLKAEGAVIKTNKWGKEYNANAGFARNKDIVNAADAVLAFWDGNSRGTKDSIDYAIEQLKPVVVIYYKEGERLVKHNC